MATLPPYPVQPLSGLQFVPSPASAVVSTGVPIPYAAGGILEAVTIPGTLRGATTTESARAWWFPAAAKVTVNVSYTDTPGSWPLNSPSLAFMFAIGVVPIPSGQPLTWSDVFQQYVEPGGLQPLNAFALNPQLMVNNKNPPLTLTGFGYISPTGVAASLPLTSSDIDPTGGLTISSQVCGNWPFSGLTAQEVAPGAQQQQYLANCPMYSIPAPGIPDDGRVVQCVRNQLFYYFWIDNSDPNFAFALPFLEVNLLINLYGQMIPYPVSLLTGYEYPPYVMVPPIPL